MSENALPSAGWLDDPSEPETLRYWNGTDWTRSSVPKTAIVTDPRTGVNAPAPGLYDDPVVEGTQRYWDGAAWTTTTAAKASETSKSSGSKWLLGFAIIVGLLLVGAVGLALGQNLSSAPSDGASASATPTAESSEAPAPEETTEPEAPTEPTEPAVDPGVDVADFTEKANKQVDDIDKALDDMATAVNEGKALGVLVNFVQVQFNNGQLLLLDAPESVTTSWDTAMADLETSLNDLGSELSDEDTTATLSSIEDARAAAESVRTVANSAT